MGVFWRAGLCLAAVMAVVSLIGLTLVTSGRAQTSDRVVAVENDPSRVAIVIGVADYRTGPNRSRLSLSTPANDARAYADVLHRLGWSFTSDRSSRTATRALVNLREGEILRAITDAKQVFGTDVRNGTVLFVFNGHGFIDNGQAYVLPAPSNDEVDYTLDVRSEGLAIEDIVEEIERELRPRRIVLIINACGEPLDQSWLGERNQLPAISHQRDTDLLVLYSSFPGGIAYDLLADERAEYGIRAEDLEEHPGVLSVFSRHFIPRLQQEQPLLELFTRTRIDVERYTAEARRDLRLSAVLGETPLQVPFVLHDQIDGTFSLASALPTAELPGQLQSLWREDPRLCRRDPQALAEALAERPASLAGISTETRDCIFEASLEALGLAAVDPLQSGDINVITPTQDSQFLASDVFRSRITVFNPASGRNRQALNSPEVLEQLLIANAFIDGTEIDFLVERDGDTLVVYCTFSAEGAFCGR